MEFTIKDRITTAEPNAVLSYALDYRAEFEVDDEWKDKVVTARFVHSNGEYIDVVLDNFGCNIPLFPKGVLWVGAYTDAFTSTAVPVPIGVTIKDLGEHEAIPPTADVYQQIIALIEAGRLKGDKGDPGEDYVITESDYQAIADRVPQPDLTDYVKNTDYATDVNSGVIKASSEYAFNADTKGRAYATTRTAEQYSRMASGSFISKGTLENVLAERLKEPQFELIEEITLTEDTNEIYKAKEPNGRDYNFRKLAFKANVPACPSANALTVRCGVTITVTNGLYTSARNTQGIAEFIGDLGIVYGMANSGSIPVSVVLDQAWRNITFFRINAPTGVNIPSGTTIKIYGIRG